jgi:hypothetical protein
LNQQPTDHRGHRRGLHQHRGRVDRTPCS